MDIVYDRAIRFNLISCKNIRIESIVQQQGVDLNLH